MLLRAARVAGRPGRKEATRRVTTRTGPNGRAGLSAADFCALFERLKRRSAWGSADRRGALNNITGAAVLAAAREVRLGRSVSLAVPLESRVTPDNPEPCVHRMTREASGAPGLNFAMDRLAMNVHGNADSHIDALCHVAFDGDLYNGVAAGSVTASGTAALSIDVAHDGIAGRGVLLDIPRLRGASWLEPGDHVTADDLAAAETAQGVRVGQGDLLFVRVGHRHRRNTLGPWDAAQARAGLHPEALGFLAERRVAGARQRWKQRHRRQHRRRR
jgi:kynurenine formamidase